MLSIADPKSGYVAHAEEIRAAIDRVLESGRYILGPEVETFEQEFADYHGAGFSVGVANGTESLELALRAVGIGRGDAVVTVANTVSATVAAVEQIGARPLFAEIEPDSMLMDPAAVREVLKQNRDTKAIVPVHLYGHPAPMPEIMQVAREFGLKVVEDCAQAHGAFVSGQKTGTWGDAAAYSFYPTKNLGALGDGGAVYTRDPNTAERVRLLRQYGWKTRYVSEIPGRNSRLDEIQAAVLRVKLRHLDAENSVRRTLAERYLERLRGAPVRLPVRSPGAVWHQFTIRTPRRDALRDHLSAHGISAGALYPVPIHWQPAYANPGLQLPETERACAELLCLPVHPAVGLDGVDRICGEILRCPRL